ncbi:MAG: thiamine pyrophosphate-dependent enzyme, partial [Candidatus Thorarchaeota archaeon]
VICVNNFIYGMTGGQVGPTTFAEDRTTTSPYGNPERPFDLARLVAAAGANYVARWTTAHPIQASRAMKTAIERRGFSFVEMISQCPTAYGRRTKAGGPPDMLQWFKKLPVRKKGEPVEHRVPTKDVMDLGVFADRNEAPFTEALQSIMSQIEE